MYSCTSVELEEKSLQPPTRRALSRIVVYSHRLCTIRIQHSSFIAFSGSWNEKKIVAAFGSYLRAREVYELTEWSGFRFHTDI